MAKILIVEDDYKLMSTVRDWLAADGHLVETAADGIQALDTINSSEFDLLIIDWGIPGFDGVTLTKQYRINGGKSCILFLTGKSTIAEKEIAFAAGADDYLTKPFDSRELSIRVTALLRRTREQKSPVLNARGIVMDCVTYEVTKDGQPIYLQKMEFALLEFFLANPNKVFSNDALLKRIWPTTSTRSPEGLRVCIKRLRDKIDTPGQDSMIQTIHGRGYRLIDN